MIDKSLFDTIIGNAPAVAILLYVAWQQQKLINLVIAACMKHLESGDNEK